MNRKSSFTISKGGFSIQKIKARILPFVKGHIFSKHLLYSILNAYENTGTVTVLVPISDSLFVFNNTAEYDFALPLVLMLILIINSAFNFILLSVKNNQIKNGWFSRIIIVITCFSYQLEQTVMIKWLYH